MNAIETKNLTKTFGGVRAVDNLSVRIPHGVATGLIGPNGSGKTTLMNLLTGTLVPDGGEIKFPSCGGVSASADGVVFSKINPIELRKLKIARTFQDGRLVNQLSVVDNLLLAVDETGIIKGLKIPLPRRGGREADGVGSLQERVELILQKIHLETHRTALAQSLSYGQRKLLELGRAMIQDTDIYLLDEPFTGLFPAVVEQVADLLDELKSTGKTLVIIEHNIGLIRRLADNVIVLDHGQLLAEGTPHDVLKNEQVKQAYLGV